MGEVGPAVDIFGSVEVVKVVLKVFGIEADVGGGIVVFPWIISTKLSNTYYDSKTFPTRLLSRAKSYNFRSI